MPASVPTTAGEAVSPGGGRRPNGTLDRSRDYC